MPMHGRVRRTGREVDDSALWAGLGIAAAAGLGHLFRRYRSSNDSARERQNGEPFLIEPNRSVVGVPVTVEVAVVKDHLARLDEAVLGPGGVVAQIHTLRDTCDRLEKTVKEQPSRQDFKEFQTRLSGELFRGIKSLREDVLKLPKLIG